MAYECVFSPEGEALFSPHLLCVRLVREVSTRSLYILIPMLQIRIHSWNQELNPDFSGSKHRPLLFPFFPPASLVWRRIKGPDLYPDASQCILSVFPPNLPQRKGRDRLSTNSSIPGSAWPCHCLCAMALHGERGDAHPQAGNHWCAT